MTLQELWELFPVVLTQHQQQWNDWADVEKESLDNLLWRFTPVINHIGSTSIPGIQAKPIVDILVEVPLYCNYDEIRSLLVDSGYICMSQTQNRMSFNKGYTPEGYAEKVFHIHIHRAGDNDEILFRDYLLSHPKKAMEYETLKLSLLPKYRNNRDAYTEAKSDFVRNVIDAARGGQNS